MLIAASALDFYTDFFVPFPVIRHDVILSTFGGVGESSFSYFTPIEPFTPISWAYWVLEVTLIVLLFWLYASTILQRLNDLSISWKWAAGVLGAVFAILTLEACFGRPNASFTTADAICLALIIPAGFIGGFGMVMILLVKGKFDRRELADNDMRKPAT